MKLPTPILLFLLASLPGCVFWLPDYSDRDTGYRLELHQPLTVRAERTRVFVQAGQVLPSGFNEYETSCSFELRQLADVPRTIEPDTFVVPHVQSLIEEVAAWHPQTLASLQLAGAAVDSSPAMIFMGWHFWLHSPTQPDVIRMTCRGEYADPWDAYPPTLEQIAWTLGKVATLHMPAPTIQPGSYQTPPGPDNTH